MSDFSRLFDPENVFYLFFSNVTLGLLLDYELVYTTEESVLTTKTLAINQIVYLKQGAKLALAIMNSNRNYLIESESTWSLVSLGMCSKRIIQGSCKKVPILNFFRRLLLVCKIGYFFYRFPLYISDIMKGKICPYYKNLLLIPSLRKQLFKTFV